MSTNDSDNGAGDDGTGDNGAGDNELSGFHVSEGGRVRANDLSQDPSGFTTGGGADVEGAESEDHPHIQTLKHSKGGLFDVGETALEAHVGRLVRFIDPLHRKRGVVHRNLFKITGVQKDHKGNVIFRGRSRDDDTFGTGISPEDVYFADEEEWSGTESASLKAYYANDCDPEGIHVRSLPRELLAERGIESSEDLPFQKEDAVPFGGVSAADEIFGAA